MIKIATRGPREQGGRRIIIVGLSGSSIKNTAGQLFTALGHVDPKDWRVNWESRSVKNHLIVVVFVKTESGKSTGWLVSTVRRAIGAKHSDVLTWWD